MRLLLIEDDQGVADYIVKGLRESGDHHVQHIIDGEAGLQAARAGTFDVMIIDRMLPGRDGLSILQVLRDENDHTPVLVLSALGEVEDRVKGLRAGGDDYLTKPFAFVELLARLEVLARRVDNDAPPTRLTVADLDMDLLTHKVSRAGQNIVLQPREFRLLEFFECKWWRLHRILQFLPQS